ncbi:hypothetical protein [Enterovibrio norvegicus]|uniref:hypothetical protein n=2 Tax=Enterovibrio norvegicus TaxID=188144 RepID=UPI003550C062
MADTAILSHFHKKQAWMASHINAAQFPTAESKQGLAIYQTAESLPALRGKEDSSSLVEGITVYAVDCHPLMVRYAKTLAMKWPESDHALMLEFLSQLSLTDLDPAPGTDITLYVAMSEGTPVATGMVFTSEEETGSVAGIYDVFGVNEDAKRAVLAHVFTSTSADTIVCETA